MDLMSESGGSTCTDVDALKICGQGVCKDCRRPWTTPNPVLHERDTKPYLVRRKERSANCRTCAALNGKWKIGFSTREIEQDLADENNYGVHMERAEEHEEQLNGHKPTTRRRTKDATAPVANMSITKKKDFEVKKNCGRFWPLAVYLREKGVAIPSDKITMLPGTNIRGTYMLYNEGCPVGSFDVAEILTDGFALDIGTHTGEDICIFKMG
jgi:hypothetical protein